MGNLIEAISTALTFGFLLLVAYVTRRAKRDEFCQKSGFSAKRVTLVNRLALWGALIGCTLVALGIAITYMRGL